MKLLRRIGLPGVLAAGVLFACLPLYFAAVLPMEKALAAAPRERARTALQPISFDARAADLERLYSHFASFDTLAEELETLHRLARASGLELAQGEYRVDKPAAGLVSYRIVLPVRGSYAGLRRFVGLLLADMPAVSLDALRFERKKSADAQLEAQLRLTLYLRPAP